MTLRTSAGACTLPPTLTGPLVFTGLGGGGTGGFPEESIPPSTPPNVPPGTPPSTPPGAPSCSGRFFWCFLQDLYVLRYCSRGNQLAVIEQRSLRFSHHSHFASWRRRRSDQYRFFQIREVKRLRITERKKYEQENEGSLSCQGNQKIDEPSRLLEIGVLQ